MIRVVVVEDEEFIRKGLILTTPWTKLRCQVVGEAENAVAAVALAHSVYPDIVITDIRMPEMSGLDMIAAIKQELDCEFIIISGYDEFDYARTALKLGVNGYLVKPVDPRELAALLEEVIKKVEEKQKVKSALKSLKYLQEKMPLLKMFEEGAGTSYDRYLDSAMTYMNTNCDREMTVKDVADALGISDSYLGKLVKQKTGLTFVELLTIIRISRAIGLMKQEEAFKIYEIAAAVGYRDSRHFSEVFKKYVGISPSEYRRGDIPFQQN